MNRKNRWILYVSFGAYVLLMFWLLFGQRMQAYLSSAGTENFWNDYFTQKINLIPLRTISEFWNDLHGGGRSHAFINLAGNVIMFVPLGFFIPCVFPKADAFRRSMLYALIIILSIEIIQLATLLGSLDIDDVLLNMIGAVIGYGIFMMLNRKKRFSKDR
ncbi:MAG: VanZ family protein [Clostridia bacterium]|nr:VanZ family protein [Clostridia bacterium]